MKKLLFIFIMLLNFSMVFGQTTESKNYHPKGYNKVFLEIGGQGEFYSLNYERIIETNTRWYPSLKIGLTYTEGIEIPFGILVNKKLNEKSQFSIGLGATVIPLYANVSTTAGSITTTTTVHLGTDVLGFLNIGYQYSKKDSNWFFGGSFMPLIYSDTNFLLENENSFFFFPWGGLQIGRYF